MSATVAKTTSKPRADREPIPVSIIKAHTPTPFDFAGLDVGSSCKSSKDAKKKGHTISYMPWMRHFRVVYNDGSGKLNTTMVHETQVAYWVPAE